MKTLSANITTGKAGDSRPAYMILIRPNSGDSWNCLAWATEDISALQIVTKADGVGVGTTTFTSATGDFENNDVLAGDEIAIIGDGNSPFTIVTVTNGTTLVLDDTVTADTGLTYVVQRDFEGGRIKQNGLGTILKEIDLRDGGNISTVSGFTFEILDQDNYSNSADFPTVLEGRSIDIKLLFTDGTGKTWANALLLQRFTIEKISADVDVTQIECIDASIARHELDLPQDVLEDGDYTYQPQENLGSALPLPYGDHTYDYMAAGSAPSYLKAHHLSPCLFLGLNTGGDEVWLVADFEINQLTAGTDVWGYDPALNRMVRLKTSTLWQNSAAGAIITLNVGEAFYDYWLPDGTISGETDIDGGSAPGDVTITDNTNCCDLDNTTETSFNITNNNGSGGVDPTVDLDVDFPEYRNSGTFVEVSVWAAGDFTSSDPGGPFTTVTGTLNGTDALTAVPIGATFQKFGTEANSEAGAEAVVPIVLTGADDDANLYVHDLDVNMVYKRIEYIPSNRLQLYAGCIGREFDTWIDTDRTTTENNNGQIATGVYVIESLIRDELSLTTSEIDIVGFDLVGQNTRTQGNWDAEFTLNEPNKTA